MVGWLSVSPYRRARLPALFLLAATATILLAGLAVVPVHVTAGAGSLRCGTILRPDTTEMGEWCARARWPHVLATIGLAVLLALLALVLLIRRWAAQPRLVMGVVAAWMLVAAVGLIWLALGVAYSPPEHDIFDL